MNEEVSEIKKEVKHYRMVAFGEKDAAMIEKYQLGRTFSRTVKYLVDRGIVSLKDPPPMISTGEVSK
jgi:hypothetical protein